MDSNVLSITKDYENSDLDKSCIELECGLRVLFDPKVVYEYKIDGWVFLFYGEHDACPDLRRVKDLISGQDYTKLWGVRGVLVAIPPKKHCVRIINDCYGSNSVYFRDKPNVDGLVLATSLSCFSCKDMDWVSFYQFLSYGYTIGKDTLISDVSRLMANSLLKIGIEGAQVYIEKTPLDNFWITDEEPVAKKIENMIDVLRSEASSLDNVQIMMSGGWDSRLLLASLKEGSPALYTHGNLESRETAIVKDISNLCGLDLFEKSFSEIVFSRALFERYLKKNDSIMFAHWSPGAELASDKGLVLTAGTFGEFLGGHYGTLNMLGGSKKYLLLLMHIFGLGEFFDKRLQDKFDSEVIYNLLRSGGYGAFWMIREEVRAALREKDLVGQSNERLKGVLSSYSEQGTLDPQTLFERFYTEHRGGRYINLQLTNAASHNKYRNIYTNRDLVRIASSIPFGYRAHNKINKLIINKIAPELLHFPMAATLSNASRPLLIQEGSRALRKFVEKKGYAYSVYKRASRYGDRSFGWNSFVDVVNPSLVDNLDGILSWTFWDEERIRQKVVGDSGSNRYSLFDMLSKAGTINGKVKGQFRI